MNRCGYFLCNAPMTDAPEPTASRGGVPCCSPACADEVSEAEWSAEADAFDAGLMRSYCDDYPD